MSFDGVVSDTVIESADVTVERKNHRGWPKTNRQLEWGYLHVVEGLSAYSAALKAGYSEATAKAKSYSLPRTLGPFVAHLQECKNRAVDADLEVTVDRVLREAAAIALADVIGFKRIVYIKGQERWIGKKPSDLTQTQRIAVCSWSEVEVTTDCGTEIDYRYQLYDKAKALVFVGRHLGMFSETLLIEARATNDDRTAHDYSAVPNEVLEHAMAALAAVGQHTQHVRPGSSSRGEKLRRIPEMRRLLRARAAANEHTAHAASARTAQQRTHSLDSGKPR